MNLVTPYLANNMHVDEWEVVAKQYFRYKTRVTIFSSPASGRFNVTFERIITR